MNKKMMQFSPRKYHWLDLFRFVAALVVVLVHVRGAVFAPFGALPAEQQSTFVAAFYLFTRIGNEAVVAFFVLSGFLVGGKVFERVVANTFQPVDYAVDRFVRIMLPLFPALLLTLAIVLLQGRRLEMGELLGNLFSLQGVLVDSYGGNAPLWSLAYEVWFYILAGAVGVLAVRKGWHFPSVVLLILTTLVFTRLSVNYLLCWLIGALAYIRRPEKISPVLIAVSLLMMVYAIGSIQIGSDSISITTEFRQTLQTWFIPVDAARIVLSIGIALLIQQLILLVPRNSILIGLEEVGEKGAAFSYSLYLSHYPIIQLAPYMGISQASNITYQSLWNYFLLVMVCLVVAWVIYWLFERHTSKVRRYLKARMPGLQQKMFVDASPAEKQP